MVSVITSSIGRRELRQCIESVRSQTIACHHYVFVNGDRFHKPARQTLNDFPEVTAIYLPEETGDCGMGPSMADVFAGGPFLTRSEWIFYLNDDDFYDHDHVESILSHAKRHSLDWCYSLRKYVTVDGEFICDDDWNSLGDWPCLAESGEYLVDNSCYAVKRSLATTLGQAWLLQPMVGDRCFLAALKKTGAPFGSTGRSTVNYRIGTGTAHADPESYLRCAYIAGKLFPDGFPWRTPSINK